VDINKHEIHLLWPDQGSTSHRILSKLDIPVSHTADIEGSTDHFLFGGKSGFGLFNRKHGKYQYVQRFWDGDADQPRKETVMRANDGGVDNRGRYWIGVMNDPPLENPGPVGKLFPL
jgi:sugar lactone lactonase YvrE